MGNAYLVLVANLEGREHLVDLGLDGNGPFLMGQCGYRMEGPGGREKGISNGCWRGEWLWFLPLLPD
jgi:hypothetical protein